jgi:hypothetical protein
VIYVKYNARGGRSRRVGKNAPPVLELRLAPRASGAALRLEDA